MVVRDSRSQPANECAWKRGATNLPSQELNDDCVELCDAMAVTVLAVDDKNDSLDYLISYSLQSTRFTRTQTVEWPIGRLVWCTPHTHIRSGIIIYNNNIGTPFTEFGSGCHIEATQRATAVGIIIISASSLIALYPFI